MDLRVRDVDPKLMARLKAKAALAQMTLSKFVVAVLKKEVAMK
jgi:predicted HicB family RNase H-like nuclease